MHKYALAALAAAAFAAPALADTKVADDVAKKVMDAAATFGFSGGKVEKEDEGSGVYELDDAKGKDGGQFDVKFDKDFKLLSVTRD